MTRPDSGDTLPADDVFYFSGQIGLNPATMEMAVDFEEQLKLVLQNIDGLLEECKLTRANIIKTTSAKLPQFTFITTALLPTFARLSRTLTATLSMAISSPYHPISQ